MTTGPLSRAIYTFKQVLMSAQLDIAGTFSVHPASPALLTSKGPHKAPTNISLHFCSGQSETSPRDPFLCRCYSTWTGLPSLHPWGVGCQAGHTRTLGVWG